MKKKDAGNLVPVFCWILMFVLTADIAIKGLSFDKTIWQRIMRNVQQQAIETYLPGKIKSGQTETIVSWLLKKIEEQVVILKESGRSDFPGSEDRERSVQIIRENSDFLLEKLLEENQENIPAKEKTEMPENPETVVTVQTPAVSVPLEKFEDFDYVMKKYYTVDKTTSMSAEQLNAPELVRMDMRIEKKTGQPQILIYHSHSQENFIDSVPGEVSDTIVGVGSYLTDILTDTYGYQVLHVTDTFDIVDGKLDRNRAYTFAKEKITQILEENPSIEVVIDLHRDGVAENKRLVTEINGEQTAKIMFFNGLSRTRQNGEISYLPNPYIRENLAFSLQMMLRSEEYYPGLARTIYLRGYRYNLHLRPKTLLVECGAQTNTVQEEKNAMKPLADILNKVLTGN